MSEYLHLYIYSNQKSNGGRNHNMKDSGFNPSTTNKEAKKIVNSLNILLQFMKNLVTETR